MDSSGSGTREHGPQAVWPAALGAALPPGIILWLTARYAVNVPYMDHWEGFLGILEAWDAGTLSFSQLWAQHNEHRLFASRLVMLALAAVSGWNVVWEQYLSVVLQAITLGLIVHLAARPAMGMSRRALAFFAPAASLLLFSAVQVENWSWGWQLHVFFNVLGVTLAVWAPAVWYGRRAGFWLAAGGAAMASFSFANGLMAWVAVPLGLWSGDRRTDGRRLALWTVLTAAAAAAYLAGYQSPGYHPPLTMVLNDPFAFAGFIGAYIGSPFGRTLGAPAAAAIGFAGIAAGVALAVGTRDKNGRGGWRPAAPWIVFMVYAAGCAALTAAGRMGFGVSQALFSRYTSFAMLFWVGLAGLAWVRRPLSTRPARQRAVSLQGIAVAAAAGLTVCYALAYADGIAAYREHGRWMARADVLLDHDQTYGAAALHGYLHPFPRRLVNYLARARRLGVGPYRHRTVSKDAVFILCAAFAPRDGGHRLSAGGSGSLVMLPGTEMRFEIEIGRPGSYRLSVETWHGEGTGQLTLHLDDRLAAVGGEPASAPGDRYEWTRYSPMALTAGSHVIQVANGTAPSLLRAISLKPATHEKDPP